MPDTGSHATFSKLKQRRQKLAAESDALGHNLAAAAERARLARLSMREIMNLRITDRAPSWWAP